MKQVSVFGFGAALDQAQDQLDWGTQITPIRQAARSLMLLDPPHPLVRHLELKVAREAHMASIRAHFSAR